MTVDKHDFPVGSLWRGIKKFNSINLALVLESDSASNFGRFPVKMWCQRQFPDSVIEHLIMSFSYDEVNLTFVRIDVKSNKIKC